MKIYAKNAKNVLNRLKIRAKHYQKFCIILRFSLSVKASQIQIKASKVFCFCAVKKLKISCKICIKSCYLRAIFTSDEAILFRTFFVEVVLVLRGFGLLL